MLVASNVVDGKGKKIYQQGFYKEKDYDTKQRFNSYWHQIHEIISCDPASILEVGVGNAFLSDYLKKRKFNLVSCDIDPELRPDKIGTIVSLPFKDSVFDLIVCFQVLEHLDYEFFPKALSELFRVSSKNVVISLPDIERCWRIAFRIKNIQIRKYVVWPCKNAKRHIFDGEHHWEIGKAGYSLERICRDIQTTGFIIERTYRVFENPYHRFFILKKDKLNKDKAKQDFYISKYRIGNLEDWRSSFFEK